MSCQYIFFMLIKKKTSSHNYSRNTSQFWKFLLDNGGAFDSKSLRTTVLSSLSRLLTTVLFSTYQSECALKIQLCLLKTLGSHYKKSYNEAIVLFLNQTVSRLAIQKRHILLLFSIFILKLSHRNRFLESTHLLSH